MTKETPTPADEPGRAIIPAGPLDGDWQLVAPITATIDYENGEFIVVADEYETHSYGTTRENAIKAFRTELLDWYLWLQDNEAKLSAYYRSALDNMRAVIKPA